MFGTKGDIVLKKQVTFTIEVIASTVYNFGGGRLNHISQFG